jgi:hypothetical protein
MGAAGLMAAVLVFEAPTAGQAPAPTVQVRATRSHQLPTTYRAARTQYNDGHPDLSGIWQAVNTAYWDLEDHPMAMGGLGPSEGAMGAVYPGLSVVEGGTIPYQPWALEQRKFNFENRRNVDVMQREAARYSGSTVKDIGDPELKCYMAGIPRSTYLPHPFQIVQTPRHIVMAYQYANSNRLIRMGVKAQSPSETWMGWGLGHWEGETLVVQSGDFNGKSWFDRAGNFASDQLKVVERFTATGPDHLSYEATITDPTVFTRPWKIQMPLYRRVEKNAMLLEFRCVELTEELLYGKHVKKD